MDAITVESPLVDRLLNRFLRGGHVGWIEQAVTPGFERADNGFPFAAAEHALHDQRVGHD